MMRFDFFCGDGVMESLLLFYNGTAIYSRGIRLAMVLIYSEHEVTFTNE